MQWPNVGELIRSTGTCTLIDGISRVLMISPDDREVSLIQVDKKMNELRGPYVVSLALLRASRGAGTIECNVHHHRGLTTNLAQLSKKHREEYEQRKDQFTPLIAAGSLEQMLFDPEYRFEKLQLLTCVAHRQARRLFNSYLVNSFDTRAFSKNYAACGAKGAVRIRFGAPRDDGGKKTIELEPGTAAPPAKSYASSLYLSDYYTDIEKCVVESLVDGDDTRDQGYVSMLRKLFPKICWYDDEGEFIISDPKNVVSTSQYLHVVRKTMRKHEEEVAVRREERRRSMRSVKGPRTGWNYSQLKGPGQVFEIDSSKKQVRMCASLGTGRIIEPATIYSMIDAYTGLIVAAILSPRKPSFALALYFLRLCFRSKVGLFKRLGLKYTDDHFPCRHLPTLLMADRAEFCGHKGEMVAQGGITVRFAKPMSPWSKGMVENRFNQIKQKELLQPGAYRKFRLRREEDGRADACITYDLGQRLLWQSVYEINSQPMDPIMVPSDFTRDCGTRNTSHTSIFKWAEKRKYGFLRTLDDTQVFEEFSFRSKAIITAEGLSWDGDYYRHDRIHDRDVPVIIEENGDVTTEIIHDDVQPGTVWFKCDGQWLAATSRSRDVIRAGVTVWDFKAQIQDNKEGHASTQIQAAATVLKNREENAPEIAKARRDAKKARTEQARETGTRKQRIKEQSQEEVEYQQDRGLVEIFDAEPPLPARDSAPAPEPEPEPVPIPERASTQSDIAKMTLALFMETNHVQAK